MKTKNFVFLFLMVISLSTKGQEIQQLKIKKDNLPSEIKYSGIVLNAVTWNDESGENIVVTTETGVVESEEDPEFSSDAELFAYRFIKKGNQFEQVWRVYDFVKNCPVDIEASFVPNTFEVTDLNLNGVAEVWLMYRTVCHGDVSPLTMKVIMYEGDQKFAMRGRNKVRVTETDFVGGEYKFDLAFQNGPDVFRHFAEKLWKKNLLHRWE
ncbi:MAG: hypothetical protein AAF632_05795 [Bacteroidota bacterium]